MQKSVQMNVDLTDPLISVHNGNDGDEPKERVPTATATMASRTEVKKVIVPTLIASKMQSPQSSASQPKDVTFLWKGHHDFLAEAIVDFKRRECQADANVTFMSPDADGQSEEHKVHRLILSIFLPTIKQSLETTGLPRLMTQLDLSNLAKEADDVRALIEFIYTGEATVSEDRLEPLRRLAAALDFEGLMKTIDDCQKAAVVDSVSLDGTASAAVQEELGVVAQEDEGEMMMTSSTSSMQTDQ